MSTMVVERPRAAAVVTAAPALRPPVNPYTREKKALGDPTPLACTVAKVAVEAVLGAGGLDFLTRWVSPELRTSLARQAALAERSGVRPAGAVRILRVRIYRVSDDAAEAAIIADDGRRVRAVAARFEAIGGRWRAEALDIG